MKLFALDNHAPNAPTYFEATPSEEARVKQLLEHHYPALETQGPKLEIIGGVNINSQNYRLGQFYIKLIQARSGVDYVENFPRINQSLKEVKLPAPTFLPNLEGKKVSLLRDASGVTTGYLYVQRFLEAQFYSGTLQEFKASCELIETLGSALDKISPTPGQREPYLSWDPGRVLDRVSEHLQQSALSEWDQKVAGHLPGLRALASLYLGAEKDSTSPGLQHYDLHPHNLFFRDGELASVLDLESFRVLPASVARGFNLFKLARKSVACLGLQPSSLSEIVKQWWDPATLGAGAKTELLRRITLILSLHYLSNNTQWDQDLDKHLNGLLEVDELFKA